MSCHGSTWFDWSGGGLVGLYGRVDPTRPDGPRLAQPLFFLCLVEFDKTIWHGPYGILRIVKIPKILTMRIGQGRRSAVDTYCRTLIPPLSLSFHHTPLFRSSPLSLLPYCSNPIGRKTLGHKPLVGFFDYLFYVH